MSGTREITLVPGMTDYVHEIPETLERAAVAVPPQAQRIAERVGRVERIELVGSGTSLHGALAVRTELEARLGVEVRVRTPSEYLTGPRGRVGAGTLMLAISQTGRSTGTIDAMADARGRGAFTVLVTGWPDSSGADAADAVLDIACGPEWVGARTKGYVATLYALLVLSDALSPRVPAGDAAVDVDVAAAARRVIADADAAVSAMADALEPAAAVWMVSYGTEMATAREGALKLLETVRIPIPVFDVEEYMHGPYHCLEADTFLIFIAPEGPGRERFESLVRFVADRTRHVVVVESARTVADERVLRFPVHAELPPRFGPLLSIVPLQLLSAELTWRRGREPGVSRYPDFHDLLASKTAPPPRGR